MTDSKSRRNSESKNPNGGQQIGWYLLALVVLAFAVFMIMAVSSPQKLSYQDFVALVEASGPDGPGRIEIERPVSGSSDKVRRLEISNLRDVRNSLREVEGTITVASPDAELPADRKPRDVAFRTNKPLAEAAEQQLINLLNRNRVVWDQAPDSTWLQNYLPMLLMIGVLLLMFVFMMRRLGGAGSPMQFGRSRGKLYALEDLGVTFDDVAGIDEAVEEVREVVDFLRSPDKYQRLGGRIPKGVLLVGPPGTGKTLLAKAIAGEAGVPFFSLSGSDFVEMFVGVGAARVRDMFQQAEQKAPCIIFIDELDALGKSRGASIVGGHDEREQTLNALLVEMDGFDSNNGVIVMAATNRPETLDQALLRPGRFDRHVLVDRPDVRGREEILKVHVKNVKLDPTVDLQACGVDQLRICRRRSWRIW